MVRFATLILLFLAGQRAALAVGAGAAPPTSARAAASYVLAAEPGAKAGLPAGPTNQTPSPSLSVYPNPARGQTTVQISGPGGAAYQLRLSNVLGNEVRRLLVRPDNAATEGTALDLSTLPPGVYFCSLLVNDKTTATKRLTVL